MNSHEESQKKPVRSWLSTHWRSVVGIILFVILVIIFCYVSGNANTTAVAQGNAAGLLALIAAAAVGIERILEGFWTIVGQLSHAWWPINEMAAQVKKLEDDLNTQLEGVYTSAASVISKADEAGNEITKELTQFNSKLTEMRTRITDLQGLANGNQRVNLIAATAQQNIGLLEQMYPGVKDRVQLANQAIAGLTDFVASFRDNPARRISSLFAGAMMGLVLAWAMQLDVFLAVFGTTPKPTCWPYLSVALTGLLIGLGSGPTHDVISVLQEVKKLRAAQSQPGPSIEGAAGEGGSRDLTAAGTLRRFR